MVTMSWKAIVVLLSLLSAGSTINKPVYKIILTQKGFAQFVQYDVEIPPLREFTFCTWIRVNNLDGDQSIFTYVVNGNSRIVRLWLDSGGRHMKVTINDKVFSSIPVDITQDVWRHVCLSYQSDFGAWALYIDSRLASCEASQSLYGFVIPGSGSIIIGYGRTENDSGSPKGLEGEVFGTNMILASTIERNYTIRTNPEYEQKKFKRNKINNNNDIEYIVLKDLQTDEIHNSVGKTLLPPFVSTTKSYVKVKTPYSFIQHDVGKMMRPRNAKQVDTSSEKEILDVVITDNGNTEDNDNRINFWNLVNDAGRAGKFKVGQKNNREPSSSSTRDLPMLTEYELPPPPGASNHDYLEKNLEVEKQPVTESIYNIKNEEPSKPTKSVFNKRHMNDIAEIETPPPPQEEKKVYGQWTSSRFAGSVLNYLKSINFHSKEKKVPATIPLTKYSDSFPYATDFRPNMIKPSVSLKRKNLIIEKRKYKQNTYLAQSPLKRLQLQKRNAKQPQINVQIVQDDKRIDILRSHAKTKPKNVEVSVRGRPRKHMEHRFYRNIDSQGSFESSETDTVPRARPFNTATDFKNQNLRNNFDIHKSNSLLTALPFLKSVEYFTEESENYASEKLTNSNDMYSKSLSNANKWHNVKSYNNDYTPRRINMTQEFGESDMDIKISELNKKHPSIRLKYKPETNKLVKNYDDTNIIKGRELAIQVSNQSDYNKDSISILKYNHGFLPGHDEKSKTSNKQNLDIKIKPKYSKVNGKNNFNKHVKIGNALNEQHVIGINEEQKKKSFVGGNERIPDIHRYRSDIDNEIGNVPSSIKPRACHNVELYDHILYVKPDESIDMSEILSPIKRKNVGIEFIMQNYKKCSLEDSPLVKSNLLLLHWSRTPVRLFGGAYPKKTTDLCGFF